MLIAGGGNAAAIRGMQPGFGLQVIASEAAPGELVMVDAAGVFYSDGGVEIRLSEYASLQMNDAPDSPPTASDGADAVCGNRIWWVTKSSATSTFKRVANAVKYLAGA